MEAAVMTAQTEKRIHRPKSPRPATHIERRLGYLKAQQLHCDIATVSGATFRGYVVSFDETAVVIKPKHSDDPADLITISMRGLEFIAPYNTTEH